MEVINGSYNRKFGDGIDESGEDRREGCDVQGIGGGTETLSEPVSSGYLSRLFLLQRNIEKEDPLASVLNVQTQVESKKNFERLSER